MGCYPRVTLTLILISLLLMARWAVCYARPGGLVWDVVPCDSDTHGPTGQYVADGPVDPCVPAGPVGLCGSSSLSDPKSVILVDTGGTFPSSDLAVRWDPTIPVESASLRGPVRPVMPV